MCVLCCVCVVFAAAENGVCVVVRHLEVEEFGKTCGLGLLPVYGAFPLVWCPQVGWNRWTGGIHPLWCIKDNAFFYFVHFFWQQGTIVIGETEYGALIINIVGVCVCVSICVSMCISGDLHYFSG